MAQKIEAKHLPDIGKATPKVPVIGVFATSDPRIDQASRTRCQNIAKMAAETISHHHANQCSSMRNQADCHDQGACHQQQPALRCHR